LVEVAAKETGRGTGERDEAVALGRGGLRRKQRARERDDASILLLAQQHGEERMQECRVATVGREAIEQRLARSVEATLFGKKLGEQKATGAIGGRLCDASASQSKRFAALTLPGKSIRVGNLTVAEGSAVMRPAGGKQEVDEGDLSRTPPIALKEENRADDDKVEHNDGPDRGASQPTPAKAEIMPGSTDGW